MRRQATQPELQSLFQGIGEAVWYLQYAEDALNTYLTMKVEVKTPGAVTAAQAQELLAKHRRSTLGQSLKVAEKLKVLPANLYSRLEALKEERNWLVHRSMHEEGDSLYTSPGRAAIFARLESFIVEAVELRKALAKEVEAFVQSHGLSVSQAEAMGRQKIARLKGDA